MLAPLLPAALGDASFATQRKLATRRTVDNVRMIHRYERQIIRNRKQKYENSR